MKNDPMLLVILLVLCYAIFDTIRKHNQVAEYIQWELENEKDSEPKNDDETTMVL